MTKKLQELFELPLDEINELAKPIPDYAQEVTTDALTNLEKIENALPQVRGLEVADIEMDGLADLATSSYKDLMDLGMQVDSRFSSEIFNVAGTMLGHAITAKTAKLNKKLKMIEINYLCIHYKLRNKNLSPILISEITRRAFKNNIRYAFYAGGNLYPNSIVKTSYFDRLLNINKFVDIGYLGETNTLNLNKLKKRFEVNKVQNLNLLELKEEDCLHVCNKLNEYLNKLKIKVHFELDDFKHKFLPKENLIYSFISGVFLIYFSVVL